MKKDDCIKTPKDIDWIYFWSEKLKQKIDRNKDWDKAAPHFGKSAKRDDYHTRFIQELDLNKEDSVLDLGCGEGSITLPIAKKVKTVTGIDSSKKMLEILNDKCEKMNINNVKTIKMDLNNLNVEKLGKFDIVIASRCLNSIVDIGNVLDNINKIANKRVYVTLFGPNNWKLEKDFYEKIGKPFNDFPSHDYFFNILISKNIYPNVLNLNIGKSREYSSIEEACESGKWRRELLTDKELKIFYEYINKIMVKNPKTGQYFNPNDKADWVLIWWEK